MTTSSNLPSWLEFQDLKLRVAVGSVWLHENGKRYTVIGIANWECFRYEEYPPTVIYVPIDAPYEVYAKRLDLWLAKRKQLIPFDMTVATSTSSPAIINYD